MLAQGQLLPPGNVGPNLAWLFASAQGHVPSSGRTSPRLSVFLWVVGVWRAMGGSLKEPLLQVGPAVARRRPKDRTP